MTIYLDVIWVLNFFFDSLLLYLVALTLKRDIKYWRLFFGGVIGSFIILLSFTPLHSYSGHPVVKMFFSALMILAVFGYKRISYFLKGLLTLYFTTFLIGGILIGAHYFIQFDVDLSSSVLLGSIKGFGDPISWLFVILGFPIAWHFSKKSVERIEITKITYEKMTNVSIKIGDFHLTVKGLVDSGNQLYDPISKMPVMFVSIKKCMEKLPEPIEKIALKSEEIIMGNEPLDPEWEHTIRIIPYKVVGQEHQLIIAVKPDELRIETENEVILVEKGLISFTAQQLSSDDAFQCIVHPKMLTGTKKIKTSIKVS